MELRIRPAQPVQTRPFLRAAWKALLAIGILTLGYCAFVLLDAKVYQFYEGRRFERAIAGIKASQEDVEITHPPGSSSPVNLIPAIAAGPILPPKPGLIIGEIEIKTIGLKTVIAEGIDDRTLRRAVGHVPGTARPGQVGNAAIAGHRDTLFLGLRNIQKNDEITLTTVDGSYLYRVDWIELVDPDNIEVLDNTPDATLTLVTCFPFFYVGPAPKRFIVRAHKIAS